MHRSFEDPNMNNAPEQCFFQNFSLTTVEKIASSLKKLPTCTRPPPKNEKVLCFGPLKNEKCNFLAF
jgi:hypothetical protein